MFDYSRFRDTVNQELSRRKLSRRKIAEQMGLDHTTVGKVLNGINDPTVTFVQKLCEGLKCTAEERKNFFHLAGFWTPEEHAQMYAA